MNTKTRGIVLRSVRYGDAKLIIDVLTELSGRISFAVRVPKTAKGKLKRQYFQPMTLLDMEYDWRERNTLQNMKDVRIALPYTSIPFEPVKSTMLLFLAEFLYYVTRDEQQNATLFNYIYNSLEWLDNSEKDYANFHLVFMIRLGKFLGFQPYLEEYTQGAYFDLRNGCFTSSLPFHADYLPQKESEQMYTLMRMTFDTMKVFKLSHNERNRITEYVLHYYRLHVPNMPDLKSFEILREVFA